MSGRRQGGGHVEYDQWSSPAILRTDAHGVSSHFNKWCSHQPGIPYVFIYSEN